MAPVESAITTIEDMIIAINIAMTNAVVVVIVMIAMTMPVKMVIVAVVITMSPTLQKFVIYHSASRRIRRQAVDQTLRPHDQHPQSVAAGPTLRAQAQRAPMLDQATAFGPTCALPPGQLRVVYIAAVLPQPEAHLSAPRLCEVLRFIVPLLRALA